MRDTRLVTLVDASASAGRVLYISSPSRLRAPHYNLSPFRFFFARELAQASKQARYIGNERSIVSAGSFEPPPPARMREKERERVRER